MPLYLATTRPLPEADADETPLLDALLARGVDARLVAWNREPAPVDGPVVLRSTWDYYHRLPEFLAWCAACPRLFNPLPLARWSAHKGYLLDLAAAGIPIVPTIYLPQGAPTRLEALRAELGWTDVVVKPVVGAGSWGARRLSPGEGEAHLSGLLSGQGALVQPWMAEVQHSGERSVVWIAGEITHSVRKSPRLADDQEDVSGPLPVAADEEALARAALALARARTGATPLYGRVDMVRDAAGLPRVMELELLEPSLFLRRHPPALERFADALAALAATPG